VTAKSAICEIDGLSIAGGLELCGSVRCACSELGSLQVSGKQDLKVHSRSYAAERVILPGASLVAGQKG
jgi:hypothetical protein